MNAPQTYAQTPEAKTAYDARWKRIMDCVNLKTARPHADFDVLHLLAGQVRRHQPSAIDV